MDISVSKNKYLIELNNGELVDINEVVAKLSKMQNLEADLYEANNRIKDLLGIVEQKDEMINLMSKDIYDSQIECYRYFKDIEDVKKYFEERCKNAND